MEKRRRNVLCWVSTQIETDPITSPTKTIDFVVFLIKNDYGNPKSNLSRELGVMIVKKGISVMGRITSFWNFTSCKKWQDQWPLGKIFPITTGSGRWRHFFVRRARACSRTKLWWRWCAFWESGAPTMPHWLKVFHRLRQRIFIWFNLSKLKIFDDLYSVSDGFWN